MENFSVFWLIYLGIWSVHQPTTVKKIPTKSVLYVLRIWKHDFRHSLDFVLFVTPEAGLMASELLQALCCQRELHTGAALLWVTQTSTHEYRKPQRTQQWSGHTILRETPRLQSAKTCSCVFEPTTWSLTASPIWVGTIQDRPWNSSRKRDQYQLSVKCKYWNDVSVSFVKLWMLRKAYPNVVTFIVAFM